MRTGSQAAVLPGSEAESFRRTGSGFLLSPLRKSREGDMLCQEEMDPSSADVSKLD